MAWSRLVNCLPRAAVLIQRLSWENLLATVLKEVAQGMGT
jgi:hypothetical protein